PAGAEDLTIAHVILRRATAVAISMHAAPVHSRQNVNSTTGTGVSFTIVLANDHPITGTATKAIPIGVACSPGRPCASIRSVTPAMPWIVPAGGDAPQVARSRTTSDGSLSSRSPRNRG